MSDPSQLNIGADEPVTEVEMSAEDLLALSPSPEIGLQGTDLRSCEPRGGLLMDT